jgi:hypothetical protein
MITSLVVNGSCCLTLDGDNITSDIPIKLKLSNSNHTLIVTSVQQHTVNANNGSVSIGGSFNGGTINVNSTVVGGGFSEEGCCQWLYRWFVGTPTNRTANDDENEDIELEYGIRPGFCLSSIKINGSASVCSTGDEMDPMTVTVSVRGSGTVSLHTNTTRLRGEILGSGTVNAPIKTNELLFTIHGSGTLQDVAVRTGGNVAVYGSGTIHGYRRTTGCSMTTSMAGSADVYFEELDETEFNKLYA